jgi:hypothetical protein
MAKNTPPLPTRCIFCGKTGVTKEHVWGKWLLKEFPHIPNATNDQTKIDLTGARIGGPNQLHVVPTVKKRQGHPLTRQVRVVCKTCNGGWMGELQSKARSSLVSLIKKPFASYVSASDQLNLVRWITMVAMTTEFTDVPSVSISAEDRAYFMKHRVPPVNSWAIWIGAYSGKDWAFAFHHEAFGVYSREVAATIHGTPKPNTQVTILGLGEFCAHIFSSPTVTQYGLTGPSANKLVGIWPLRDSDIAWPPAGGINSDRDLWELASALERALSSLPNA